MQSVLANQERVFLSSLFSISVPRVTRDKTVDNLHCCNPGSPSLPELELMTQLPPTQDEGTENKTKQKSNKQMQSKVKDTDNIHIYSLLLL